MNRAIKLYADEDLGIAYICRVCGIGNGSLRRELKKRGLPLRPSMRKQ